MLFTFEILELSKLLIYGKNSVMFIYDKIKILDLSEDYPNLNEIGNFSGRSFVNLDFEKGLLLFFNFIIRSLKHKRRAFFLRNSYFEDYAAYYKAGYYYSQIYCPLQVNDKITYFLYYAICLAFDAVGEASRDDATVKKVIITKEDYNFINESGYKKLLNSATIVNPFNGKSVNYKQFLSLIDDINNISDINDFINMFDTSLSFIIQAKNKSF